VPRAAKGGKAIEDKGKGKAEEGQDTHGEEGSRMSQQCINRGEGEAAGGEGRGRGGDGDAENGEQGQDDAAAEGKPAWPTQRGGAWTAGAAASARTGIAGLSVRTAGAPRSASTTDRGATAKTAGAPPSASTTERGA
jgi:hypothetical protein